MAFDLLAGKQGGRSWSRGTEDWYPTNPWIRRVTAHEASKISTPLIVGVGVVTAASLCWALFPRKSKPAAGRRPRVTEPTIQIPRESMKEVVYGKR